MVRRPLSLLILLVAVALVGGYFLGYNKGLRLPPSITEEPEKALPVPQARGHYVQVAVADVRAQASAEAELVTQALLGDEVKVLPGEKGQWLRGQVPDGYIGWLKASEVVDDIPPEGRELAVVAIPLARLYREPTTTAPGIGEAVLGTDLPLISQKPGWVEVWLPGGRKAWLQEKDVELWPEGKPPGQRGGLDVVKVAEKLLGAPYLWGGVSIYGVDCSGLTYVSYFLNGIKLPRDADQQFQVGRKVERTDLRSGDLVFFNTEESGTVPTHVGIYSGDGQFINARSRQGVVVSRLEEPLFARGYLGARRYLP